MTENEVQHVDIIPMSSNALEAQERATVDIQIATAKRYPRSIEKFQKDATNMIKASKQVAESCVYNRPVGKDGGRMKFAEGPSIRLAEIVASCYGNLRVATIITEVSPRQVKAQGMAFDLEKNYAVKKDCIETTVTKSGAPFSERMRVVVAKACQSKALRDAVFGVVPRALCNDLIETAKETMTGGRTVDQLKPGVLEWIKKLDIDAKRVWTVLDIEGPAELTMEHIITLGGLKTAISDSEITVNEVFPLSAEEQKANDPAQKIKDHFAGKNEEPPAEKKKKANKTKSKTSSPPKAPEQESKPEAGPDVVDPAPPEPEAEDTSPAEPEDAGPPDKYKCKCGRTFPEMKAGKCPYCFSNKVMEI